MIYQKILRPVLFKTNPERIHNFTVKMLGLVSRVDFLYKIIIKYLFVNNSSLQVKLGKMVLRNPVGLAAGFDKDIDAPYAYPMLGFGFSELGSITNKAQSGNPKPRLWRLPKDKALIVYYGLCNNGADKAKEKLAKLNQEKTGIFGVSIASTTGVEIDKMADDYLDSFLKLYNQARYITLNVSCPNVANCDLPQQISFIEELLQKVSKIKKEKDIFIKIGPGLSTENLDKIIGLCLQYNLTGIVATNLVKKKEDLNEVKSSERELSHPGGVSGGLLQKKSDEVIKYIYKKTQGKLQIIGVGGVFTAQDAYRKIKNGASAVQLITGFIYGGPFVIKKINKGLVELLKKDCFTDINQVVGKNCN
jgi:dihydroorotate dehydrogenase